MSKSGSAALRGCLAWACLGVLASAGSGHADEIADLKARLEAQQKQIQELKQMLQGTWSVMQSQPLPPTVAGGVAQPGPGQAAPPGAFGARPLDETAVNGIVEKYLKDHPGSDLPAGNQFGYEPGNGFVIRSGRGNDAGLYQNWSDQSRVPFEMQIHGRVQSDYYGYKVTDTRNHFTGVDTGSNTAGDESALLIKRARIWVEGSLFDPDLRYNITLDGNTRGIPGFNQRGFGAAIGNVPGGQVDANVDNAVRLFNAWISYDFHPCWSDSGCGDCPDGTYRYKPTYRIIAGKIQPTFGFEEFVAGTGNMQFVDFSSSELFFDADDNNQLVGAALQIRELDDRLFLSAMITNGQDSQIPFLSLDNLPGFIGAYWYDFGGTWDDQAKQWQLYGNSLSDLAYSCNPVLRVGGAMNLVPMGRRSIYGEAEQDRVRVVPGLPNNPGFLGGVLNGGGILPATAGVPGTSAFALDAFDSYTFESYASLHWRGFSLTSDSWLRNLDNFRGMKGPGNRNRPILYNVNNIGSNALTNVALFNRGGMIDYGSQLQAGYFVVPKKVELVARYEWIRGQTGDIRGNGTFSTLTPAQTVALGIPAGTTVRVYNDAFRKAQESTAITFGVNYFIYGQNVKWQTDVGFYNGGNPGAAAQSLTGVIPGVDGYLLRTQFQLTF